MRSTRLLVPVLVGAIVLAACGDDRTDSLDVSTTAAPITAAPATAAPDSADAPSGAVTKPEVSLPSTMPTELVVTDLTVGTGREAQAGDTLIMRYVGVRSEDGTEFDNNFDSGQTFNLELGAGDVIAGWDQGLVGIQTGGRRQLDIPADLAYGDTPRGDVIQPGDALTFVVDAVAVVATPDAADRPDITITGGDNVAALEVDDLVVGEGPAVAGTETVMVYLTAYRADTGEQLISSWDTGAIEQLPLPELETGLPGLVDAIVGMQVGGRRQASIPAALVFDGQGNPNLGGGLPANVDMVVVVDLFAAY